MVRLPKENGRSPDMGNSMALALSRQSNWVPVRNDHPRPIQAVRAGGGQLTHMPLGPYVGRTPESSDDQHMDRPEMYMYVDGVGVAMRAGAKETLKLRDKRASK